MTPARRSQVIYSPSPACLPAAPLLQVSDWFTNYRARTWKQDIFNLAQQISREAK
jgi:hypothetical protein